MSADADGPRRTSKESECGWAAHPRTSPSQKDPARRCTVEDKISACAIDFLHSRAPDARQSSHVLFLFTSRIPASVAESKRSSLKVPESFRIPSTSVSFLRPHPSDSFFIHRQPSTPIDDHRPPSSNVSGSPPGDQNTRDIWWRCGVGTCSVQLPVIITSNSPRTSKVTLGAPRRTAK